MKRIIQSVTLLLLLMIMTVVPSSCGDDDDGVMERPDYTSIIYKIALSEDLMNFYNVTAVYTLLDGTEITEDIQNTSWEKKDKVDGERRSQVKLTVTAKKRPAIPTYDMKRNYLLECDYSAEYYTKTTSAKREARKGLNQTVKGENIKTFLEANETILLIDYHRTIGQTEE